MLDVDVLVSGCSLRYWPGYRCLPLLVAGLAAASLSGPLLAVAALSVLAVGLVPRSSPGARPGRGDGRVAQPMAGLVIAGACVGPLVTMNSIQAERCMPVHRRAEGFAVLNTAQGLGFAAGSLTLSLLRLTTVGLLASAAALVAALVLASVRPDRQAAGTAEVSPAGVGSRG